MIARLFSLLCLLGAALPASAHFVFVAPDAAGRNATVVFSEDLKPDGDVDVAMIGGTKLFVRDLAGGEPTPLPLGEPKDDAYTIAIPGEGGRVIGGSTEFGVRAPKGEGKPYLLIYLPKAVIGDAFDGRAVLGRDAHAELLAVGKPGELRFKLIAEGRPVGGAEVNIVLPDGKATKATTDDQGVTSPFPATGRYAAWSRHIAPGSGEHGGKKYEEVRRYPTLVIDVTDAKAADAKTAGAASAPTKTVRLATMPQAASSFGAAIVGDWLYVYGGHIARVHTYSTEAVSGQFHRLNLKDGKTWEPLPGGPALQGMNLVAHGGHVYRIGGMRPLNKPGEKADNHSTADCARFNPETKQWEPIASLPEPRSSHDIVALGDKLYVVGGWNMRGHEGNDWLGTALVLDLKSEKPQWQKIKQPFERRAFIGAAHNGRIYMMGGLDEDSEVIQKVEILDVATGQWSHGPDIPGDGRIGFAPAACSHDGRLFLSVADGTLYRLDEKANAWEKIGQTTPRIVHRMAPHGGRLIVAGGAARGENLDIVEAVEFTAGAAAQASAPAAPAFVAPGGQTVCPIMTGVAIGNDHEVVEHNGVKVLICCDTCMKKWKADPAAYLLPQHLPQLAGKSVPQRKLKQIYCPVYRDRVVSENDPFVMYKGQKVHVFNKSAAKKFEADPAKYADASILPQLAEPAAAGQ